MRRQSWVLFAAFVAALLLVGSVASAGVTVVVKVPFPFMLKDKEMPAGRYEIRENGADETSVTVEDLDTGHSGFSLVLTRLADSGAKEPEAVFDKAEGKYYLSEVRVPGEDGIALVGAPGKHTHVRVSGSSKR